ncbi:MAG: CopD family protein [Chloroflexi bacterium]|nr:CopD family protein [Chloroflexota bacterium]
MTDSITPWIHLVAVTVWLGPQFFMFLVTVPALRAIEDAETRVKVMRVIIYRFGWMAWAAMAVIVLTGISNLFQEASEPGSNIWDPDYRYFQIFSTKMVLVGLTVLLTAAHTFFVGPRQLRLAEEMRSDSPEATNLRRVSIVISSLALLASVAVVFAGALLADHDYSFRPV